jgi:hypothetical protein
VNLRQTVARLAVVVRVRGVVRIAGGRGRPAEQGF